GWDREALSRRRRGRRPIRPGMPPQSVPNKTGTSSCTYILMRFSVSHPEKMRGRAQPASPTLGFPSTEAQMKTRFFGILALLLAVALPAAAADLAGKWTAEFDSPIGVQKYIYEFKKSGDALTGQATYDDSMGKGTVALENLKIDGDKVSFEEPLTI